MAEAPHIMLVEARFYDDVADELARGAIAELEAAKVSYERQEVPGALRVVGRLLDQGAAPLALLGALANHFRRLVRARACQPLEAKVVARALSLHPYAAEKLVEQLRRFDLPRLRASLAAIRGADEALKGGSGLPPRLAFERLVLGVSA